MCVCVFGHAFATRSVCAFPYDPGSLVPAVQGVRCMCGVRNVWLCGYRRGPQHTTFGIDVFIILAFELCFCFSHAPSLSWLLCYFSGFPHVRLLVDLFVACVRNLSNGRRVGIRRAAVPNRSPAHTRTRTHNRLHSVGKFGFIVHGRSQRTRSKSFYRAYTDSKRTFDKRSTRETFRFVTPSAKHWPSSFPRPSIRHTRLISIRPLFSLFAFYLTKNGRSL